MTPDVCGARHVLNEIKRLSNIKKICSKGARNIINVNIKSPTIITLSNLMTEDKKIAEFSHKRTIKTRWPIN